MDFKKLYERAQRNAREQEKKVKEAAREMETSKRKQEELITIERSREKFDLKRKILQHKPEIKNSAEQKKDLVIPKKASQTSENNIRSFKNQNCVDEKKINHLNDNINKSISHSQNNYHKGNSLKKVNKTEFLVKNSKAPAISNSQNFNSLLKQAERNDATAVENLFNEVESSSSLNKKLSVPVKQKKVLASEELGVTAGLNLSHFAAREKQKEIKQKNKIESKMTNCERAALDLQKSSKMNKTNTKMSLQNQKLINSQFPTTKNNLQSSTNANSIQKKLSSLPKSDREKQELTLTNKPIINKTITKKNNNKVRISLPSKTFANKTTNNISINSHPDFIISQNPSKKYLPGDIRYQGPNQSNKNNSLQQKPVISLTKKSISLPSTEKIQQKTEKQKTAISNTASLNKKSNNNIITSFVQKNQSNINKKQLLIENKNKIKTPLQNDRLKELPLNNNRIIKNNMSDERPLKSNGINQLKRPSKPDGISLAHIKRESINRHQMLQNIRKGNSSSNSSKKTMRYANYSETEDDDDDEDEGGGYGEEYDSDLADFIDDSMVDDLQREDLEETLRLINPRYNKQKWLVRERMIDDRRMDSKFKDVELEERRSAKYGLVEDLIEAKRGSKALA